MTQFSGFPEATRAFLAGIAENNSKAWFEDNRALYQAGYVEAGRSFVEALGPELRSIAPEVQYEGRIGGSLMRVNRDVRFSKDKRPYKEHLDLMFWHGGRKGWDMPGFFLRLTPQTVWMGAGMHVLDAEALTRFRDAVVDDRSGHALAEAARRLSDAGPYTVGGATRKQVPRGYDKAGPRAGYLMHEGLYAHFEAPAEIAYSAGFGAAALQHFRNCWPIGKWLLDEVARLP